jgi:hypothetical protein
MMDHRHGGVLGVPHCATPPPGLTGSGHGGVVGVPQFATPPFAAGRTSAGHGGVL